MDPQALSAIASAVSMAVLVIAAAMDVRSREVRDGCWAAMFAVAAVCMAAGMLGSGTAASLAAAASVALVAADLLWDREGGAVDAFLYAAIALSAVAAIVLSEGPARYAYASFPAVYVLMLALYYAGVVRGGADAKAVIAVAASMPAYCPLSDAISLPAEPAVFMFPPAIAVLVLAAVMVLLLAPCFLIRNLVRGDWAFSISRISPTACPAPAGGRRPPVVIGQGGGREGGARHIPLGRRRCVPQAARCRSGQGLGHSHGALRAPDSGSFRDCLGMGQPAVPAHLTMLRSAPQDAHLPSGVRPDASTL